LNQNLSGEIPQNNLTIGSVEQFCYDLQSCISSQQHNQKKDIQQDASQIHMHVSSFLNTSEITCIKWQVISLNEVKEASLESRTAFQKQFN
jgi:hypothetical protein